MLKYYLFDLIFHMKEREIFMVWAKRESVKIYTWISHANQMHNPSCWEMFYLNLVTPFSSKNIRSFLFITGYFILN
jgi:hypothetical protein